MAPKSHTLFHFTQNKETMKLILKNGFWPRYCLEDIRWVNMAADYMAFPMVCFCDIPLGRISEHVNFYGSYGLGMTKEWANANGLNPIMYLASDNNLMKQIRSFNEHANKHSESSDVELAKKSMRYLYMHIKPSDGNMLVDGDSVSKEFYQESEWRYVPQHEEVDAYLKKSEFDDEDVLINKNKKVRDNASLKFSLRDIKYIFVKNDADIADMINFIQHDLENNLAVDLKVLMSRVISLESIQADL